MPRFWVLLLCPSLLSAATWVVPAVTSRTLDSGARATTTLRLRNPTPAPATIQFQLLPATADPVILTLDAGSTLVLPDPLQSLWGIDETTVALQITADQSLLVAAETTAPTRTAAPILLYDKTFLPESAADLLPFSAPDATTVGVVFLQPGSADLIAYNAEGAELARQTVALDQPGVVQIPATSLAAADAVPFRYELQVNAGRLAAYLEAPGPVFTAATPEPTGAPRLAIPIPAGRLALHLFNPDDEVSTSLQATLYPLAGGDALATAKISAPAAGTAAYDDLAADPLGLDAATAGLLQLAANNPVVLQARVINPDGLTVVPPSAPPGNEPTQLIALDADAALGLTAGPDGAAVTLTLLNTAGETVAATDLALDPNSSRETTLASLFELETLPENAALQIDVIQGTAAAYAHSAATLYQEAQPLTAIACEPPAIESFSSTAAYPTDPGSYDLAWTVYQADSVSLSGVGPVPATGSTTVDLEASTTYELTATGLCGTTTRQLTVSIGAPALTALLPAEANPGQTVTLTLDHLADPHAVTGAQITFPNGTTAVLPVNLTEGQPAFTVPLPRDAGGVEGDYTGPVTIAARLSDGAFTKPLDFTITRAAYEGDATADFRQWIDTKAAQVRDVLNRLHDQPELAAAIDPLLASFDPDLAVLQQMADDIAANGSAVLPAEPANDDFPDPQPVTVTRADLESIMALIHAMTPPEPESVEAWKARVRAAGESGPCLADDVQYSTCYAIAQIDSNSLLVRAWQAAGGIVDEIGRLAEKFTRNPYVIAFNRIRSVVGKAEFYCNLYPIYLDSFNARPFPDPVPVGGFREVRNDGTRVFALLKARWTREQAVDQLVQTARNFLIDSVIDADTKTSKEGKDAAREQAKKWTNWLYQRSRDEVQRMADQLGLIDTFREVQVYKCDLKSVLPQGLARNPLLGRDVNIEPEFETRGEYVYGFYGKQDGGLTYAQITTFPNHFVELTANVNQPQKRGVNGGIYGVPIEVGRGVSSLKVTYTKVEQRQSTRTLVETYREFKVTPETRFDYTFATPQSSMALRVVKTGPAYKIDVSVTGNDSFDVQPQAGLQLTAKLRRQRGNRQQLRVRAQAGGSSSNGYAGASLYFTNDGSAANTSPRITYAYAPNALNLGWNFTSTGARSAFLSIGVLTGGKQSAAAFSGTLTLPVP